MLASLAVATTSAILRDIASRTDARTVVADGLFDVETSHFYFDQLIRHAQRE